MKKNRKKGDLLLVSIESDGLTIFKGNTPLNQEKKVAELLSLLENKGLKLPKKNSSWWN